MRVDMAVLDGVHGIKIRCSIGTISGLGMTVVVGRGLAIGSNEATSNTTLKAADKIRNGNNE